MFLTEMLDSIPGAALFGSVALIICLTFLFDIAGIKSLKIYIRTRLRVRNFIKRQQKRLPPFSNSKTKDVSAEDVGIIPSAAEYELEKPQKTPKLPKQCDGVHFVGMSADKHLIDLCINKIQEEMALVWIYIKCSDGTFYKLPSADTRKAYVTSESMFSSSGLQIKCLSPLRKWRVSFNGVLEKCDSQVKNDNEIIHVKFSFVWLAMSGVHELNFSYAEESLTKAFIEASVIPNEIDLKSIHNLQNRYEQWGQMMGTIKFKGEAEKDYYFWSVKTRIADIPLWDKNVMSVKAYMYFMDGVPLKFESVSVQQLISNLTSGFTVPPHGPPKIIPLCNFNVDLSKHWQKEMKCSCIINGDNKKLGINFIGGDITLYTGPKLQFKLLIRPFVVRMNGTDEGFGILHHSEMTYSKEQKEFEPPPLLLKDLEHIECEQSVYSLEDEKCQSSSIAGGKGSSLAMLTQLSKRTNKFVVPTGFVISTKAFENHLNSHEKVLNAVRKLKDVSCKILEGDLKSECSNCRQAFVATQLSELLKKEIIQALSSKYDEIDNVKFSIRSSVFGEDSEDLSAAGQMLTILGVRGIDNICKAIIECWASKFGFEAVQYSRLNGQSILSPMAVVVQEMVSSDFSGVMFTVDPVTGDPTYPYITANFGLGETVVSALADPDTIILKREKDQSLKIFKTQIGTKMTQAFLKSDEGVEQKTYESKAEKSCLTDEWAIRIAETGILIESCFCSPRDIEWAVHNNQLYMLQARPITTLHTETEFELIHDQDTPVKSIHDFWTRANTGEVFLGATSPLGIALVVTGMDLYGHRNRIIRESTLDEFCPYFLHLLPVTHRQVALNLVDMLFRHNEKEITAVQKSFEIALFGRSVITENIHQAGIKKYGYAPKARKIFMAIFIPKVSYSVPRDIAKFSKKLENYSVSLDSYTSAQIAWEGILSQLNFCSESFAVHGMATFLSSFYNMMLMTTLSKGKKEWDSELYCDFATLLSSCSGVESADVPESMQELARTIALNHGDKFSSASPEDAYNLIKNDSGPSGVLFQKFLEKHGHRCVKEFDIYSKSWGMQPESLIPTLQNMVRAPAILNSPVKETLSNEAILSKIKTPLSALNRRILKIFLSCSRKYVREREKTKSMLIRSVDWLRKSCYRLGDLMVREGMLPDAELVFFLAAEEIQEILAYQKPGLVSKAIRRKRLHQQLNELKLPEIIEGIPKPIQIQEDFSNYPASFSLKGTPVCQGTVKAKAVVVLALEEASKIESGDILITYSTDTGWSPYFPLLSGVVTVLGGLISHGAVVAREFGLPCVVGVENATAAFKSGDIVILNGTEGTVTKVLEDKK